MFKVIRGQSPMTKSFIRYLFIYLLIYLFIYLFIYKICHQQNKDKIDNIKNTKAGAVHREELQLREPLSNRKMLTKSTGSVWSGI